MLCGPEGELLLTAWWSNEQTWMLPFLLGRWGKLAFLNHNHTGKKKAPSCLAGRLSGPAYLSSVPMFRREFRGFVDTAALPRADWAPDITPLSISVSMAKSLRIISMLLRLSQTNASDPETAATRDSSVLLTDVALHCCEDQNDPERIQRYPQYQVYHHGNTRK